MHRDGVLLRAKIASIGGKYKKGSHSRGGVLNMKNAHRSERLSLRITHEDSFFSTTD